MKPQNKFICKGPHRFHCCDVVGVPASGVAVILGMCVDCGETFASEHSVAKPGEDLILRSEIKTKK
jgi:hypothetical protein